MNRLFNFDRRINRATYFAGIVIGFIAMLAVIGVLVFLNSLSSVSGVKAVTTALMLISGLAYTFYALCLTKQRANDISGDNAVLYTFLAIFILSAIIGVIPGEPRKNRYGNIPARGVALK